MSLTETSSESGESSYLLASASIDFASGDALQSASLGNSRIVGEIIRYMGKDDAPSSLVAKPMGQTDIESLTIPIMERFYVGNYEMYQPKDTSLGAGMEEIAGCRCWCTYS